MSLILDALRKIEQERRTRRQGSMDIRADVLNYQGRMSPARKSPPRGLIGLLGLGLIIAGALAFYRQESSTMTTQPVVPATTPLRTDMQQAAAIPSPPPSVQASQSPKPDETQTVPAPKPATTATDSIESMVISGIAWQEERSLRRAVINGVLAGEGAEIIGAKIVEIREDRVIFSRNGRNFEVPYAGGAGR